MDGFFPFFSPRKGDRTLSHSSSPWHQSFLSIPADPDGLVRLELTVAWVEPHSGSLAMAELELPPLAILPLAITWPRSARLPASNHIAEAVWPVRCQSKPRRARTGFVVLAGPTIGAWRARTSLPQDWSFLRQRVPRESGVTNLREAFAWAARLHVRKW